MIVLKCVAIGVRLPPHYRHLTKAEQRPEAGEAGTHKSTRRQLLHVFRMRCEWAGTWCPVIDGGFKTTAVASDGQSEEDESQGRRSGPSSGNSQIIERHHDTTGGEYLVTVFPCALTLFLSERGFRNLPQVLCTTTTRLEIGS